MSLKYLFRSARTGRIVTRTYAETNPAETTRESVPADAFPFDLLEAVTRSTAMHGYAETIRRLNAAL